MDSCRFESAESVPRQSLRRVESAGLQCDDRAGRSGVRPVFPVNRPRSDVVGAHPPQRHHRGVRLAVGSGGRGQRDVWVAWHTNTLESTGATGGIQMRRSIDGGQNSQAEISPFPAGTADITTNVAGGLSASSTRIPNVRSWLQGSLQPRILLDPFRPGSIYVVSVDNPGNNYAAGDPSDIVLARSTDNGANWARSTISHAPAGTVQFMPSAAIDQQGNIGVTWYDTRSNTLDAAGNFLLDVFATFSNDGGQTFLPNDFRINDASFNPDAGAGDRFPMNNVRRIGEYNGLDASNGIASAIWTGNTFGGTPPAPNNQQPRFDTFALSVVHGIDGLTPEGEPGGFTLGYTSDEAPALASHNGALYLAFAGEDGHLYLDFKFNGKPNWGPGAVDTGQLTDDAPTLISLDNQLFLGWTGTDEHLNVARVNTAANGTIMNLSPAGEAGGVSLGYTSDVGPALASLNGALYLAHAGQDDNLYLDFKAFKAPDYLTGTLRGGKSNWGPGAIPTSQRTEVAPAMAALNNRVFFAWTGTDDHLNVAAIGSTVGTVTSPLQVFPVANGILTVNGDQFGADFNDDIVIEQGASGGVKVTLNGQVAEYDPGAITGIIVNTAGGTNTVRIGATFTAAPVTIAGGGTDRLTFLGTPSSSPMYTPGANGLPADGTLNVGNLLINFTGLELVEGVAPHVTGVHVDPETIDENGLATVTGTFTDPGSLSTHRAGVNWGDGTSDQPVSLVFGTRSFTFTHRYLDDNPTGTATDTNTITPAVTDNDNLTGTGTTSITVNNVAPVITAVTGSSPSSDPAKEGALVTISATFTDIGTLDTHTATVDWGDGTVSAGQITESGGSGHLLAQHAFTSGGIYTVGLRLRDDDTGLATATKTEFVTGVGVQQINGRRTLVVVGSSGDDTVSINQANGQFVVHASFLSSDRRVLSTGIELLDVALLGGNDRATVAGNISLPSVMDGGDGNDFLFAGNGTSILIGGDGDDMLTGAGARDILIGGVGADRLVGNGGDDVLIGGYTSYDSGADDDKLANDAVLLKLLEEWNSGRS